MWYRIQNFSSPPTFQHYLILIPILVTILLTRSWRGHVQERGSLRTCRCQCDVRQRCLSFADCIWAAERPFIRFYAVPNSVDRFWAVSYLCSDKGSFRIRAINVSFVYSIPISICNSRYQCINRTILFFLPPVLLILSTLLLVRVSFRGVSIIFETMWCIDSVSSYSIGSFMTTARHSADISFTRKFRYSNHISNTEIK